jgi:hypothetical protein
MSCFDSWLTLGMSAISRSLDSGRKAPASDRLITNRVRRARPPLLPAGAAVSKGEDSKVTNSAATRFDCKFASARCLPGRAESGEKEELTVQLFRFHRRNESCTL